MLAGRPIVPRGQHDLPPVSPRLDRRVSLGRSRQGKPVMNMKPQSGSTHERCQLLKHPDQHFGSMPKIRKRAALICRAKQSSRWPKILEQRFKDFKSTAAMVRALPTPTCFATPTHRTRATIGSRQAAQIRRRFRKSLPANYKQNNLFPQDPYRYSKVSNSHTCAVFKK